jgi:GTPase SAR1 family protein
MCVSISKLHEHQRHVFSGCMCQWQSDCRTNSSCTQCLQVYGRRYPTRLWDTAGLEGCNVIPSSYFRGAAAAVVVYDIANEGGWLCPVHRYEWR